MKEIEFKADERIFPKKGNTWEKIKKRLVEFRELDVSDELGRLNIYCHKGSEELERIRSEAYSIFAHSNAFLTKYMDGMGLMEAEVLRMALEILNGEKDQSSTLPAKNWGETRMSTRRLNYEKKIFAGAPSARGVCYLDGTNMYGVDASDGTLRWQRTNFPPRSML